MECTRPARRPRRVLIESKACRPAARNGRVGSAVELADQPYAYCRTRGLRSPALARSRASGSAFRRLPVVWARRQRETPPARRHAFAQRADVAICCGRREEIDPSDVFSVGPMAEPHSASITAVMGLRSRAVPGESGEVTGQQITVGRQSTHLYSAQMVAIDAQPDAEVGVESQDDQELPLLRIALAGLVVWRGRSPVLEPAYDRSSGEGGGVAAS